MDEIKYHSKNDAFVVHVTYYVGMYYVHGTHAVYVESRKYNLE